MKHILAQHPAACIFFAVTIYFLLRNLKCEMQGRDNDDHR